MGQLLYMDIENKKPYKELGKRTQKARVDNTPLDQEQMAKELGVSRSAYAQYESGRTPIPSRYVPRFCEITGVNSDWLLNNKGPMLSGNESWEQRQYSFLLTLGEEERKHFEDGLKFIFPNRFNK